MEFLQVYEQMGHMTEITSFQALESDRIFIPHYSTQSPHHPVFKTVDNELKLRVVFNGSAKSETGLTLNEFLLPGPILQTDIAKILIWGSYKFFLTNLLFCSSHK